jgi:hypothetical protein
LKIVLGGQQRFRRAADLDIAMVIRGGCHVVIIKESWLKTGKAVYHQMARFWTKAYGLAAGIRRKNSPGGPVAQRL